MKFLKWLAFPLLALAAQTLGFITSMGVGQFSLVGHDQAPLDHGRQPLRQL